MHLRDHLIPTTWTRVNLLSDLCARHDLRSCDPWRSSELMRNQLRRNIAPYLSATAKLLET